MSVCAHRPEETGFFTPCTEACNGACACATEVADETGTEDRR